MKRRTKRTEPGFALIEVLVAVVIIAVGVVYVFKSFSSSVGAVKRSMSYHEASIILERALQDVDIGNLHITTFRDSLIAGENARYVLHVDRIPSPHLAGLGVSEVYVNVTWDDGTRELGVSTLVHDE